VEAGNGQHMGETGVAQRGLVAFAMPPRSPVIRALAMAPSLPGSAARIRAARVMRKFSMAAPRR
jgi:hypothetical protein